MTTLDPNLRTALRSLDPGLVPGDLADRAYRRAIAEGRGASLAERFIIAGRRLAVVGTACCAAIVCVLWLSDGQGGADLGVGGDAAATLAGDGGGSVEMFSTLDPRVQAVYAWTGLEWSGDLSTGGEGPR